MERIRAAANSRLMRLAQKMIVVGALLLDRVATNSDLHHLAPLRSNTGYAGTLINPAFPRAEGVCDPPFEEVSTGLATTRSRLFLGKRCCESLLLFKTNAQDGFPTSDSRYL